MRRKLEWGVRRGRRRRGEETGDEARGREWKRKEGHEVMDLFFHLHNYQKSVWKCW